MYLACMWHVPGLMQKPYAMWLVYSHNKSPCWTAVWNSVGWGICIMHSPSSIVEIVAVLFFFLMIAVFIWIKQFVWRALLWAIHSAVCADQNDVSVTWYIPSGHNYQSSRHVLCSLVWYVHAGITYVKRFTTLSTNCTYIQQDKAINNTKSCSLYTGTSIPAVWRYQFFHPPGPWIAGPPTGRNKATTSSKGVNETNSSRVWHATANVVRSRCHVVSTTRPADGSMLHVVCQHYLYQEASHAVISIQLSSDITDHWNTTPFKLHGM